MSGPSAAAGPGSGPGARGWTSITEALDPGADPDDWLGKGRVGALGERACSAIDRDDPSELALAVAAGMRLGARDGNGLSALAAAASRGSWRCAGLLVGMGADARGEEPYGDSALRLACQRSEFDVLESMADAGLAVGLHELCRLGEARALRFFLGRGADPDARDGSGRTSLMRVKRGGGGGACAAALLEAGASVALVGPAGETALMMAMPNVRKMAALSATMRGIEDEALELLRALLAAGADPTALDAQGRSTRDYCGQGFAAVELALSEGLAAWEAGQMSAEAEPGRASRPARRV